MSIYDEIKTEREFAHAKHGATSMEETQWDDLNRLAILVEEVGEVAKEFNDARNTRIHLGGYFDVYNLRKELIQVAAMAAAWADVIPYEE